MKKILPFVATYHKLTHSRDLRVALVGMPWGSVQRSSVALSILKPCVEAAGFIPEVHLFNIRFAKQLGIVTYEAICNGSFHLEWPFAQLLFGSKGLKEIRNDWSDIKSDPDARFLFNELKQSFGGSEELCEAVANTEIPKFIDDCLEQVDWAKYMAVGFTTTFAQSLSSLALARRIKECCPWVKIIFGGANVDSEMGVEFVRGFPWVDYVVHGEAERSFPALLNRIAAGDEETRIPGVSMRRGAEVVAGDRDANPLSDLNESPMPDYSDYIQAIESNGLSNKFRMRLFFESSRGCWWGAKHHCTFCGLNGSTMAYRRKDSDKVFSELIQLSKQYRCLTFCATDNILAPEYFKELLPRLAAQDIDWELFYEVKANLTREQIELFKAAGIKEIQPGIESLNTRILKLMRKGVTAIQNIQLLKWCYEFEILPYWNLLYGFPGEIAEDYTDLPRICRLLTHLTPPESTTPVTFQRFSPYFFDREKFGLTLRPWSGYRYIFPEERVNLDKVAYVFEGKWDGRANPEEYIAPVKEVWREWRTYWEGRRVFCYYEKGIDYLLIHDNRPKAADASLRHRRLYLNEQIATIYLYCDQYHSLKSICKMFEEKFPGQAEEDKIRAWLGQLVAQGVMFREDDQYLSLAVRKKTQAR